MERPLPEAPLCYICTSHLHECKAGGKRAAQSGAWPADHLGRGGAPGRRSSEPRSARQKSPRAFLSSTCFQPGRAPYSWRVARRPLCGHSAVTQPLTRPHGARRRHGQTTSSSGWTHLPMSLCTLQGEGTVYRDRKRSEMRHQGQKLKDVDHKQSFSPQSPGQTDKQRLSGGCGGCGACAVSQDTPHVSVPLQYCSTVSMAPFRSESQRMRAEPVLWLS
ncbi:hypothetical protein EYF80_061532 [Liparis tanakae]|uniref:Uncharacterized protein n=1 Tax=Liparis tanakae TaxID=230148 RepID=A0A4Z2EID0_9TELE|nr:hypothetical protein EYF80_061532 [Liparis tanakae]